MYNSPKISKGNRTLLGTDFRSSAGLILDVKNACWYFWDNPTHKYPFGEELDTPSIAEKMSSNTCQLIEGEGESLTSVQKEKLNLPLESFQNIFEPEGETTTILEHHTTALTPSNSDRVTSLIPLRKRGRPPKVRQTPGSSSGSRWNQRGRI
ncbi:retrovirus-related Pol polyprotein from transposon 17.6 [Trichonephila clavipes]|nr:retrovirus-related Pol polyprotein from transposon 17.6 [Trichonephila clavipes]